MRDTIFVALLQTYNIVHLIIQWITSSNSPLSTYIVSVDILQKELTPLPWHYHNTAAVQQLHT